MFKKIFLAVLILLSFNQISFAQTNNCKEIIGYYPNWQWYDRAKLVNPMTLDYSKYTIINYAFFKPETSGAISSTDTWADDNLLNGQPNWAQGGYYPNTSIISRAHNAGVKVLPSIGGWTLSDNFPVIAASATKRTVFANACAALIQQYNFDGIDIDWEYPGYVTHGGSTADKVNFTLLMQEIRSKLTTLGTQNSKNYLLTACFGAATVHMNNIEWQNIVPIVDAINLMSYDFYGTWDATTNHNAPLYAPAQGAANFHISGAVELLLNTYNVPANKINAGLAFYGRSHKTTTTPTLHGAGNGTADNVTFSDDDGSPLFYNVLKKQSLFNKYYDNQAQSPYLLGKNGLNTFLSYDDTTSILAKATYIKNKNLRGTIIWEITGDYIETAPSSGVIAGTPLANAINTAFCSTTTTTCNAPTNIVATPTATTANISWSSSGANSYNVQFKAASANTWTTSVSTTTSFVLQNLSVNTAYQVQVQSVCGSQSSSYSTVIAFTTTNTTTGGGGSGTGCSAPSSFNFTASNFIPMGEIKIGQARLNPIWGVTVDAYIPQNRKSWAIAMAHAAHLFRNVAGTDKIPANFYFATAAKESFCGCDQNITAAPSGTNFPFTYQASSLGDGCFQIENLSAYTELVRQYPQRFPAGQHAQLIGSEHFETAALTKAYYDIFTVKYWEVHKNWNPIAFFNTATDPNAAIKLMSVAYNRGLWYTELGTVLNTSRTTAITANSISNYFNNNVYGFDYQNALTNYTNILGNNTASLDPALFANNPATGQPYNQFNSFYDAQLTWSDVSNYIDKIIVLYPTLNPTIVKNAVQTTFNSINAGGAISFRYQLGTVLNTLMLQLPADNPSANIAATYGCGQTTVVNQPPIVSITSPANNSIFSASVNININTTASDPDGTVAKVQFYNGTTLLATVFTAPFNYIWQNVAAGNYSLTVKATDDKGAVTTSSAVTITVQVPVNQPPTCDLISPTQNQVFNLGTAISLKARASDDVAVKNVKFYQNNVLLFTDTSEPWEYSWTNANSGAYKINAISSDNQGLTTTSSTVTVTVLPKGGNVPPICNITSPTVNAIITKPANVTINANATDPNGTVIKVDFYRGTTLLGSDNTAPYSFVWLNPAVGTYSLTAKATDNQNAITTSSSIAITVRNAPNQAPLCSLSATPISAIAPANISLNATASDPDGTIAKVDFYNGTTLLNSDAVAPYHFVWTNIGVGTYIVKAIATDNLAAIKISNVVTITVTAPITVNSCSQYTQYQANTNYTQGNIVTNQGGVYTCNVAGWCSGAAWAYAPGIGTSWASAWTKTGTCNQQLPSCTTTNAYIAGSPYQTNDVVKNNGNLYVCTIPSWCSGAAIFYEPGAGSAWQQAWTLMGACPSSRPLSILQPSATSHLLIYPNPTQDILQIFLQEEHDIAYLRVEISNLNGQSVYSQTTYNEPFTLHRTIDMSAFVSGLYIIKVVTPNWESVEKVEKF